MKILVLKGNNGSGKTSSVHEMVRILTKDKKIAKFVCKKDEENFEKHKDFVVPLIYDGFLIAVSSYGDSKPDLTRPYENYKDYADVFLCASHPEGSAPYEVVKGWKQKHTVIEKSIRNDGPKTVNDTLIKNTASVLCEELETIIRKLEEQK